MTYDTTKSICLPEMFIKGDKLFTSSNKVYVNNNTKG